MLKVSWRLGEHRLEVDLWICLKKLPSARSAVSCQLTVQFARIRSVIAGAVGAHQLFFTVPGDVPVFKAVHTSWFGLATVFSFLVESAIEHFLFNGAFCLIRVGESDADGGVSSPTLESVRTDPLDKEGGRVKGVEVHSHVLVVGRVEQGRDSMGNDRVHWVVQG